MWVVHASQGHIHPPAGTCCRRWPSSAGWREGLFPDDAGLPLPDTPQADWLALRDDYWLVRRHIEAVVHGFVDFEAADPAPGRVRAAAPTARRPGVRDRVRQGALHRQRAGSIKVPPGRLVLQTLRSHDQYNTTIYGTDDRYRGITGGRRVVMVNAADIAELGSRTATSSTSSRSSEGARRRAEKFRVVAYRTAQGCAAAYFPETNVLVPLDSDRGRVEHPDQQVGRHPPRTAALRATALTCRTTTSPASGCRVREPH